MENLLEGMIQMNKNFLEKQLINEIIRIETLSKMLVDNATNFDSDSLYQKKDNTTKTSILSQITILRNELLVLAKQIKELK